MQQLDLCKKKPFNNPVCNQYQDWMMEQGKGIDSSLHLIDVAQWDIELEDSITA